MEKIEKQSEGLKEKISSALNTAFKTEEARQKELQSDDTDPTGLDVLNTPEKVASILQSQGIDTSAFKITVNNADKPFPDGNGQGGINYAHSEISIYEGGQLVFVEDFLGPEVGGW